jgi:hypothetical protein
MIENKFYKKVQQETCYRTSDDIVFTGPGAKVNSKRHQEKINKKDRMLTFSKEARKFFGLSEYNEDEEEDNDEQKLINTIKRKLGSFDYFEEFFECMVKLYSRYPAIFDMFKLIDTEFKKGD